MNNYPASRITETDFWIGRNLRAMRENASLTQQQLATAIGVSFQQLQKYENGKNRLPASRLYELSRILDTPLDSFFTGAGQDAPDLGETRIIDPHSLKITHQVQVNANGALAVRFSGRFILLPPPEPSSAETSDL